MGTVDYDFARRISENGEFTDEVSIIVEYTNAWGVKAYGLVMYGEGNRYQPSEYVNDPKIWWVNPKQREGVR